MKARSTLTQLALIATLALFGAACQPATDDGTVGDPGATTDQDTDTDSGPISPGTTGDDPDASDADGTGGSGDDDLGSGPPAADEPEEGRVRAERVED